MPATYGYNEATAVLTARLHPMVQKTINRRSKLLTLLPVERSIGKVCTWDAEGDGAYAEGYNDGADVSTFGVDEDVQAALAWGLYRTNVKITGLAMAVAANSQNPGDLTNLLKRKARGNAERLVALLNGELFSGSTRVIGLADAIGDATNTYAGIDRASKSYWRPTVMDNGGIARNVTLDVIREFMDTIETAGGERPDLLVTTPAIYRKIGGLLDPSRRWAENIVTARGSFRVLDFGWDALEIDGVPIVKDKDCQAGTMWGINSNYTSVVYQPTADETLLGQNLTRLGIMQAGDGIESVGLPITWDQLSRDGDAMKSSGRTYLQLQVRNPNRCGKLGDLQ